MPPDQPERLPDVTYTLKPPGQDIPQRWHGAWTAARFRNCGAWEIGVARVWIQLADGRWIVQIKHAHGSGRPGWIARIWADYDPRLIRAIETEPPAGP